jgi:hypothetical protein
MTQTLDNVRRFGVNIGVITLVAVDDVTNYPNAGYPYPDDFHHCSGMAGALLEGGGLMHWSILRWNIDVAWLWAKRLAIKCAISGFALAAIFSFGVVAVQLGAEALNWLRTGIRGSAKTIAEVWPATAYQERIYPNPSSLNPCAKQKLGLETYKDVIAHFTRSSLKEDGIQIRDILVRATKGIGAISRRTSVKSFLWGQVR